MKCKLLRQLESKKSSNSIEKTRAVVKDLHSRIKVAIHRIDSISKRIEELRDRELQPQLEELIEGYTCSIPSINVVSFKLCCPRSCDAYCFFLSLINSLLTICLKFLNIFFSFFLQYLRLSRMWEVMSECHKLQLKIISVAHCNNNTKIPIQSESYKHIIFQLENELSLLSSSFAKWIGAQMSYLKSINNWLFKCVLLAEKTSKRKRRPQQHPEEKLRRFGPPIYTTCIEWSGMLQKLPEKGVCDSIKDLAVEVHRFLPRQEKNQGKSAKQFEAVDGSDAGFANSRDDASEDPPSSIDQVRSSLVVFLDKLDRYAESSVKGYASLEKTILESKSNYEKLKGIL